jgi:multimeric flavodoxin WrbA
MTKAKGKSRGRSSRAAKPAVRVLAVAGSPRRGGNTDVMVAEALRGAEEAGGRTRKFRVADLRIAPCRACMTCLRTKRCAQRDDMDRLLGPMAQSAVWILGTPVYWWGPSAQFKAFVDRWFGAVRGFSFKGKKVVLLLPLGDDSPATAKHAVGMLKTALRYTGARVAATVLGLGLGDKGDARRRPGVLREARAAGAKAVRAAAGAR